MDFKIGDLVFFQSDFKGTWTYGKIVGEVWHIWIVKDVKSSYKKLSKARQWNKSFEKYKLTPLDCSIIGEDYIEN